MNNPNTEVSTEHSLYARFQDSVRLHIDGSARGAENMRRDEEQAMRLQQQPDDTIYVRFYAWQPWAVSLGANQKSSDIDENLLNTKGFDIVRRVTGGRAVLHAQELTYSVIMCLAQGESVHDVYRVSHEYLVRGLRHLSKEVIEDLVFERSQPLFAKLYREQPNSVSCFASSARYEIMFHARKVVGSAQRVFGNVLLQHGSILLGQGHEQLADVVSNRSPEQREDFRRSLLEKSATLSEIYQREVSFEECAEALVRYWKG